MKKRVNYVLLAMLMVICLVVSILPTFATSIAATIILYDIDWNEVATFHTIVDDQDEVPWWVQYNGDAYSFEYGSGNTYGYIADGGDFTGYWYEDTYVGDIEDLPYPPGYQPPEPDPDLIAITFIAYRMSDDTSINMYTHVEYGEPGDTYVYYPVNIPGMRPQYNSYTGQFGNVDSTVYILYTVETAPSATKQVQLNFVCFDGHNYRVMYSAVLNIDQSYSDFDTRSVYDNSNYFNSSPYLTLDYDNLELSYDVYLVNIKDEYHYMQPMLTDEYERIYNTGYNNGDQNGYYRGVSDENPNTLANFIPNILGSVASSFYYVISNMSIGGIALASVVAVIITAAIVILLVKVIRG